MNTETLDGFDVVINEIESNLPQIKVGGIDYLVKPASKKTDDTAIYAAISFFRDTLIEAENDEDAFEAIDKEDAKTSTALARMYGIRFQKMRDYRLFMVAILEVKTFRAIKSIMEASGVEYAHTKERISKVYRAFNIKPALFEQVNELAGWTEFDRAKEAKEAKLIEQHGGGGGKGPTVVEQESPNE